jgi:hypothetical protein
MDLHMLVTNKWPLKQENSEKTLDNAGRGNWRARFHSCYSIWVSQILVFYVVRTVNFGMKLYNDQRNA